jgi:hypothetical protein
LTFICDKETGSLLQDKTSQHFQAFFDVTMNSVKDIALWGEKKHWNNATNFEH